MKITSLPSSPTTLIEKKNQPSPSISTFSRILTTKQTKTNENILDSLFAEMDNCGSQLTERKTMETFYRYKKAVRELLDELSRQTYQVSEKTSTRTGVMQQTVRIVDLKLAELYQKILSDETHQLDVLNMIGELKGILVDRRG